MIGETDGVGWMRKAATILMDRGLPSFPRASGLDQYDAWHWHASPDVAVLLRSLHFEGQPAPPNEELFGYRVYVSEDYPAGTLDIVREEPRLVIDDAPPIDPMLRETVG